MIIASPSLIHALIYYVHFAIMLCQYHYHSHQQMLLSLLLVLQQQHHLVQKNHMHTRIRLVGLWYGKTTKN
jgi:hypothetical protein